MCGLQCPWAQSGQQFHTQHRAHRAAPLERPTYWSAHTCLSWKALVATAAGGPARSQPNPDPECLLPESSPAVPVWPTCSFPGYPDPTVQDLCGLPGSERQSSGGESLDGQPVHQGKHCGQEPNCPQAARYILGLVSRYGVKGEQMNWIQASLVFVCPPQGH